MTLFFSDRVENIIGKGETTGYSNFLLFQQYFQKLFLPGSLKPDTVWERFIEEWLLKSYFQI